LMAGYLKGRVPRGTNERMLDRRTHISKEKTRNFGNWKLQFAKAKKEGRSGIGMRWREKGFCVWVSGPLVFQRYQNKEVEGNNSRPTVTSIRERKGK